MSGLETFPKPGDADKDVDTKMTTPISTVETGGNYLKVPGGKSNGNGSSNGNVDTVPTVRIGDGDEDDDDYDPSADVHNSVANGVTLELSDMEDLEGIEDRDQWGNPLQFFCTILGFCVGLGNIWRFPYLCQTYGGGTYCKNCNDMYSTSIAIIIFTYV